MGKSCSQMDESRPWPLKGLGTDRRIMLAEYELDPVD